MFILQKPLKAASMCTPDRARWSSAVVTILSLTVTFPYFFELVVTSDGKSCLASSGNSISSVVYTWFMTSVTCFIPFSSLMVMNCIIIKALRQRGKYFKGDKLGNTEVKGSQKQAQLTAMLLGLTCTVLIVSLPTYIRFIYYDLNSYTDTPTSYAVYIFLAHFTQKLFTTNNAVNFYLYCITGSKFRHDLMNLFCTQRKQPYFTSISLTVSKMADKDPQMTY